MEFRLSPIASLVLNMIADAGMQRCSANHVVPLAWKLLETDLATPTFAYLANEASVLSSSELLSECKTAIAELELPKIENQELAEKLKTFAVLEAAWDDDQKLDDAIAEVAYEYDEFGVLWTLSHGLADLEEEGFSYHEPELTTVNRNAFIRRRVLEWFASCQDEIEPIIAVVAARFPLTDSERKK